jgi:hypothetical protein
MAYKRQFIEESLACRSVLCLFDIAILASGLLPEAKKEAVYQETAMRMLATMSFAPDPQEQAPS